MLVTGILRTTPTRRSGRWRARTSRFALVLYLALYAALLIAYLGVLVHLALKAAKEGDSQPLPGVRDRGGAARPGGEKVRDPPLRSGGGPREAWWGTQQ